MQPGDDVAPGLVAVAGERAERLLADGLRQHDVVGRIGRRGRDRAGQRGGILGHGIAAAAEEGLVHGVGAVEHQRLPVDAVGAAVIAERDFVGGALGDADGRALEVLHLLDAEVLLHDKALAVVEIDRALAQAERDAAQIGLRRVAVEHVDLAGLQRGEAVLRGQRHVSAPWWRRRTRPPPARGNSRRRGPCSCPAKSGAENPAKPALTPQTSVPRCLTVSSVPAAAADSVAASMPPARTNFLHIATPSSVTNTLQYVVDGVAEPVDDHVDIAFADDVGRRQHAHGRRCDRPPCRPSDSRRARARTRRP